MTAEDSADTYVPRVSPVDWRPTFRIIPSRFPPIGLFDRVADPRDLEAVFAVESMTNARLRDLVGELERVPPADRVSGSGASFIMAPFTRPSVPGGRYSTAEFGAYYTAQSLRTAVAETTYHRANFLRATNQPPIEIEMRVLQAELSAMMHDVRGEREARPELYHSTDYSAPQRLATRVRAEGSWGVVYDSVRDAGGECAAALRPKALARCRPAQHLAYVWDGATITRVYRKSVVRY